MDHIIKLRPYSETENTLSQTAHRKSLPSNSITHFFTPFFINRRSKIVFASGSGSQNEPPFLRNADNARATKFVCLLR